MGEGASHTQASPATTGCYARAHPPRRAESASTHPERNPPALAPAVFLVSTPTWAPSPPPPRERQPAPSPTPPGKFKSSPPRDPGNSALCLGRAPPQSRLARSAASPWSTWPALPGPSARIPEPAPPPGWGRAGCRGSRRSAGRGGCAEERAGEAGGGERRRGRRGGGGLTCATAMPAAAESLSQAEAGSGAARKRGLSGPRVGSRLAHPRERAGPRGPSLWAPFPPPGTRPGTDAHLGRGVDPEASSPRQPRAARPPESSGREAAARLRLRRLRLSPAPLPRGERD